MAHLLESFGALDRLEGFVSSYGRSFYGYEAMPGCELVTLRKGVNASKVKDCLRLGDESVVSFMAGETLRWEIVRG